MDGVPTDAVDQQQRVPGLQAADEQGGGLAQAAIGTELEAGLLGQQFGQRAAFGAFDVAAFEHADLGHGLVDAQGRARGGDGHGRGRLRESRGHGHAAEHRGKRAVDGGTGRHGNPLQPHTPCGTGSDMPAQKADPRTHARAMAAAWVPVPALRRPGDSMHRAGIRARECR